MTPEEIEIERRRYVTDLEKKFIKLFSSKNECLGEIRAGLNFGLPEPNAENMINLLDRLNFISFIVFQALVCGGASYSTMFVHEMWDHLVRNKIFVRIFHGNSVQTPLVDHQVDMQRLLLHILDGTFVNLFFPASELHSRYASVIVAIDVTIEGSQTSRGSGFIVKLDQGQDRWLVTCKHNVDPGSSIIIDNITSSNNISIEVEEFYLSNDHDVAIAKLKTSIDGPALVLRGGGSIFDEVYTLGFPQVPGAMPTLFGHRGEINGVADLYIQKCKALIISNLVSPGSSGCPVLDREGRCVGMTIDWLEGEWGEAGKQKARFSAALPESIINSEIQIMNEQSGMQPRG